VQEPDSVQNGKPCILPCLQFTAVSSLQQIINRSLRKE